MNRAVPRVLFHGYTAARGPRESFRHTPSMRDRGGVGSQVTSPSFFFSASLEFAYKFALAKFDGDAPAVAAVQISVRRPLDLTAARAAVDESLRSMGALGPREDLPSKRELWTILDEPRAVRAIVEDGYDSAVIDERDACDVLGVMDPAARISWAVFDRRHVVVLNPSVPIWTPP